MPSASSACAWSGRPPAMSANGGRTARTASSCSARSSAGTKPRMPTPHGRSPTSWRVSGQQLRHLGPPQERERQERQRARVGDGGGELRAVAHAGHGPLDDRVHRAVQGGDPGPRGQRVARARGGEMVAHTVAQRRDDSAHGHEATRQFCGQGAVLADGQHRAGPVIPGDALVQRRAPGAQRAVGVGGGLGLQRVGAAGQRRRPLEARSHEQAKGATQRCAQAARLATVHGGDVPAHLRRQRRLPRQEDLAVKHDACRSGHGACGRRVQPDPTVGPDRNPQLTDAALQQDEAALLAHPAARLVAGGDDGVGAGLLRGARVLEAERLHECARAQRVRTGDRPGHPAAVSGDDDGVQPGEIACAQGAGQPGGGIDRQCPASMREPREPADGGLGCGLVGAEAQVERADGAGAAGGHGEARLGMAGGSDHEHVEAGGRARVCRHRAVDALRHGSPAPSTRHLSQMPGHSSPHSHRFAESAHGLPSRGE